MSFNLVEKPWIPVADKNAITKLVSLHELFRDAEEISDLAVNPVQRISLMRLLVCITQAALDGPEDERDWLGCREKIAKSAMNYLDDWRDKFDLYGNEPFLQVPDIVPENAKDRFNMPMDKLFLEFSSGVLFDHEEGSLDKRTHSPETIALGLLQYQNFCLGGGKSKKAKWNNVGITGFANGTTNNNYKAGPCAGCKLFTFILQNNVLDTIWFNLVTKEQVDTYIPNMTFGRPIWEDYPSCYDTKIVKGLNFQYLKSLVPLARFLQLNEGSQSRIDFLTNGFAYLDDALEIRNPFLTIIKNTNDEKLQYLRGEHGRHPWRDLNALLNINNMNSAIPLSHLITVRSVGKNVDFDIWVGALLNDQGNPLENVEWRLPITLKALEKSMFNKYEQGVQKANDGAAALRNAVVAYYKEIHEQMDTKAIPAASAQTIFWSELDKHYRRLLEAAQDHSQPLSDVWHPIVVDAMEKAFAQSCPHTTPRQIQAFAKTKQKLKLKHGRN